MKLIAMVLGLGVAVSAAADNKFVCRELDGAKITAVVEVTDKETPRYRNGGLKEGEEYNARLEVFSDDVISGDVYKGKVTTEDVNFVFQGEKKTANLHIFMDEMDQASLTLGRARSIQMVCY